MHYIYPFGIVEKRFPETLENVAHTLIMKEYTSTVMEAEKNSPSTPLMEIVNRVIEELKDEIKENRRLIELANRLNTVVITPDAVSVYGKTYYRPAPL